MRLDQSYRDLTIVKLVRVCNPIQRYTQIIEKTVWQHANLTLTNECLKWVESGQRWDALRLPASRRKGTVGRN